MNASPPATATTGRPATGSPTSAAADHGISSLGAGGSSEADDGRYVEVLLRERAQSADRIGAQPAAFLRRHEPQVAARDRHVGGPGKCAHDGDSRGRAAGERLA